MDKNIFFSVDTGKAQDKTQQFFMTKTEQDKYRKTITQQYKGCRFIVKAY